MTDQADIEPTLEQLENLSVALGLPLLPEGMRPHYYEKSLRNLHSLVVKTIKGDEEAAKTLKHIRSTFGRG